MQVRVLLCHSLVIRSITRVFRTSPGPATSHPPSSTRSPRHQVTLGSGVPEEGGAKGREEGGLVSLAMTGMMMLLRVIMIAFDQYSDGEEYSNGKMRTGIRII